MADLQRILKAGEALTLAGAPAGFLPWLLADLARAAKGRAVFIAPDEAAMRSLADTARYFAPELDIITFPAWDCLPYDRASPSLRATSERLAGLHALQGKKDKPQLLLTTLNAATQRTLTPFRLRQLSATLAPGERIDRDALAELLQANGYVRADTVHEAGEYAVRGGLVDLFPAGEPLALRLDFFGDEIESVRQFDPADQRTTARLDGFTLLPASEALLDAEAIKRFRTRYREKFGATATGDPLYQALSEGRRLAGMEHWLPLIEEKLSTLFDHLSDDDLIIRDAGVDGSADGALCGNRGLLRKPDARAVERSGQLSPARAGCALSEAQGMGRGGRRPADPSDHRLPRTRQRAGDRFRRRCRARFRARADAERQCLRGGRRASSAISAAASTRWCWQAIRSAHASG
jgi:transcription-repair coupling factor (superfamily II helicase)